MDCIALSAAQVAKGRDRLAAAMKAANKAFRSANPGYADIAVNPDDAKIVAEIGKDSAALAKLRIDYVMANRDTATLDLLGVKTEQAIAEENKFTMTPYLAAKKYKYDGSGWKAGYQDPADGAPLNRFIPKDGSGSFQVLRAKGLFQLMSDIEIDAFCAEAPISFELYSQLFL